MKEVAISIDVYCDWMGQPEPYRIYVDNDLLTERTYLWNNPGQFVRENIIVFLEPGEHTVRVEPVNPGFPGFRYENFLLNNQIISPVNNRFVIV